MQKIGFRSVRRLVFALLILAITSTALVIIQVQVKVLAQTTDSRIALPLIQREYVVEASLNVDEIVASGFDNPLEITHAGDGSDRLFVVEQGGYIHIIENGSVLSQPFLDIHNLVTAGGEQGLLGLAFHPEYATNGYFFVNYTRSGDGWTVIARYEVSAGNPDRADINSAEIILTIPQPDSNHNGGKVAFGPDGYLYIGMGDGGGAGDTYDNGQNPNTLLGTILRLDIDNGLPYSIPDDNPFVGGGGHPAVWAYGLRNPWRFSFDRLTGDLFTGDVGQGAREEINYQPANATPPLNYGWPCREGFRTYTTDSPCDDQDLLDSLTPPILDYPRTDGRSVTGGFVYRGPTFPDFYGRYFYADFASGRIWSVGMAAGGDWSAPDLELDTPFMISTFGEDEQGELYIADHSGGTIRRMRAVYASP
jgi:glucose/arabinose dehydrogenase